MTPADRAMRDALNEGVQAARSPARTLPARQPLLEAPQFDLTSFAPSSYGRPQVITADQSLAKPTTPHPPPGQFQYRQPPPWSPSTPPEYKRVRRKQSSFDLGGTPRDLDNWPFANTSPVPSTSLHAHFLPYDPAPPLLPPFRSGPTSPSLSSTVETLPSTPPRTPYQRVEPSFDQWSSGGGSALSERLRTKRKFPQLKIAKRLPHPAHHGGGDGGVWEVHAAVIDLGEVKVVESDSSGSTVRAHGICAEASPPRPWISGKKGRSVRFEEARPSDHERANSPSSSLSSSPSPPSPPRPTPSKHAASYDQTRSSNYPLSRFKFPAPPGYAWAGTFGHLTETPPPGSPASPATLHYRGASFDVVNPHASLLLGYTDFETPAEIDHLLDDYFNRSTLSLNMPADRLNDEAAASQISLSTTTSSGRRRMYDDPMDARRNIMNLPPVPKLYTATSAPNIDSPTLPTSSPGITELARVYAAELPQDGMSSEETPLRSVRSRFADPGFEPASLIAQRDTQYPDGPVRPPTQQFVEDAAPTSSPASTTGTIRRKALGSLRTPTSANRASSMYPATEVSYPFDLESNRGDNDTMTQPDAIRDSYYDNGNIEERADIGDATGHASYYEDPHAAAREDEEGEAYATQSTNDADTIGRLVKLYDYDTNPYMAGLADQRDQHNSDSDSASIEHGRAFHRRSRNPFFRQYDYGSGPTYPAAGGYGRIGQTAGFRHRVPNTLPPTPHRPRVACTGFRTLGSGYPDSPITDQTYGNTDQLLRSTPQTSTSRRGQGRRYTPSGVQDAFQIYTDGGEIAPPQRYSPANRFMARADEDKENMRTSFSDVSLTSTDGNESEQDITDHSPRDVRPRHHLLVTDPSSTPQFAEQVDDAASAWEDLSSLEESSTSASHLRSTKAEPAAVTAVKERIQSVVRGMSQIFAPSPLDAAVSMPAAQSDSRIGTDAGGVRTIQEEVTDILLRKSNGAASVWDMHRLEELRTQHPTAHRRGVAAAERVLAAQLRSEENGGGEKKNLLGGLWKRNDACSPDKERLLPPPPQAAFTRSGALQYSETAATFTTIRYPAPAISSPFAPAVDCTPSVPAPSALSGKGGGGAESIELAPLPQGDKRYSRTAVRGQRGLRPFHLRERARHVLPTPFFGIVQSDGTVEQVSLLMSPRHARSLGLRRVQKRLTKPWLRLCGLFPLTALVFGLGGLDWWISKHTNGEIKEMDADAKRKALWLWFPMSFVAWGILGCVIAILVITLK